MRKFWWFISVVHSSLTPNCPEGCDCPSNHDEGTYVDCRARGLSKIPTVFPSDAHIIDLSMNDIRVLDEFPMLEELVVLNLTHNQIDEIEVDVFDDLERLSTLILSHNRIRFIEDDIFEWGPEQHYVFLSLEKLEEIDISSNYLYYVDNHAFDDLDHLRTLRMHNNQLRQFRPKWISDGLFQAINEVTFHDNPWSCDCGFKPMYDDLIDNDDKKEILQNALNAGQSNIICKDGVNNGVNVFNLRAEDLEAGSLCTTPTIVTISQDYDVNMGQPIVLKCTATGFPPPLVEWKAPNDDIYTVTNDDFDGVIVHLDGTMLITDGADKIDDGTYHCIAKNKNGAEEATVKVNVIYQHHDDESYEKPVLCDYNPLLHSFVVTSDCSTGPSAITHSPSELPHRPSNQDWSVSPNCPERCTCDADTAVCSNQKQIQLPDVLPNSVIHLDFTDNNLVGLYTDLCKNYNQLKSIMMDANRIITIDSEAFQSCQNLEKLTLRSNQISKLAPSQFDSLSGLKILDLRNGDENMLPLIFENSIDQLPPNAFEGMPKLEKVYLRDNIISNINPYAFHNLMNLRYIYLEGNKLYHLYRDWIAEAAESGIISGIFVTENQIECDCHLEKFRADFENTESRIFKVLQPDELRCSFPRSLQGTKLNELDLSSLECIDILPNPREMSSPQRSSVGVVGFIIGIICTALGFFLYPKYKRYRVSQNFPRRQQGGIYEDENSGLNPLVGPPLDHHEAYA